MNTKTKKKQPNESLRRKQASRLAAVQALYARHFSDVEAADTVDAWADDIVEKSRHAVKTGDAEMGFEAVPERALLLNLLESALAHEAAIDEWIRETTGERWETGRTGPLLSAILHIGVAELKARPDKDAGLIISEYVAITEQFFDDGEVGFVNGILAGIAQKIR